MPSFKLLRNLIIRFTSKLSSQASEKPKKPRISWRTDSYYTVMPDGVLVAQPIRL